MRKFTFGIGLLLLIFLLVFTSSQMAPVSKASAAGALDHFVFSNISTQTAGTAFQIAITAVDTQGSTVTVYNATNALNVSTGAISPTSVSSFKKGVWTGQVTLTKAASGVTISTSGSNKSGTSNTFKVNAGALDHFVFSNISTQTAGTSFSITITAEDAYNNTVTSYTRSNTLSDSTGTISPKRTSAFSAGSWTGQVTITKAASGVTISTSGSRKTGQSNSITVTPGAPARFTITGYPTSVMAGQNFGSNNVVVTAYDASGNIKTDYRGSVYFNSTDAQAVLPYTSGSRYTFTSQDNGFHTFTGTGFTLKTTPSQTITVTDGSRSATSNSITVTSSVRIITVTSNPTGSGYIRVDGQAYATPATFNWTIGSTHNISANYPVIITPNQSRYVYSSWSDSGTQSHTITVSSTSISTFTAKFRLQYYLSVSGGNSIFYGTASPTSDNWYDSGSSTTVSSLWVWNTVMNQSRVAISNWQLDGIDQNPTRRNSGNLMIASVSMSTYHTVNFVSTIQYYLMVSGGNGVSFGTASPTSDNWYDSGTSTTISSNWIWNVVQGKSGTGITNWQLDNFNQTVLFSNGFEDGTDTGFTAWNYIHASGTGSTAIASLSPHSGTSDAMFVSDPGGYSHCGQIFEPSAVAYARAYYRFSTLNLGSWDILGLLRLSHGNYTNSVTAQILYHDGNYYWQLATSDGLNNYFDQSVSSNITTGVWYCIEIKRDVINGQEQLWVDGVSKVSAAYNITGNSDRLEVGITYGGNVPGTGNTCYVDDVAITGAYKAPGGPKTLSPQGRGTLMTPSITMSTYHTVVFRNTSQFYLTVNSTYGMAGGMGWYDSGSTAYATLMNGTVSGGTGIRFIFMSWAGDASGSGLNSSSITMNAAKTADANWKKQYFVVLTEGRSVSTSIVDSNSTVTGLAFNSTNRKLSFNVSGASGTIGFANITIAKSLIGDINGVKAYLDGDPTNFNFVSVGDSWLLQFTYQHSTHRVDVSLGSAPATTGSAGLSPLTNSVISIIGVISGAVLLITVAWSLLGEAGKRLQKGALKAVKQRTSRLPTG